MQDTLVRPAHHHARHHGYEDDHYGSSSDSVGYHGRHRPRRHEDDPLYDEEEPSSDSPYTNSDGTPSSDFSDSEDYSSDEEKGHGGEEKAPASRKKILIVGGLVLVVLLGVMWWLWSRQGGSATDGVSLPIPTGSGGGGTSQPSQPTGSSSDDPSPSPSPVPLPAPTPGSGSSGPGGNKIEGLKGASINGIYIGWVPHEGEEGPPSQTLDQYNAALGGNWDGAFLGWYAQLPADGGRWDGEQLNSCMDDLKKTGAIFQPAVMPTRGWKGLTPEDNSQALDIARVMKRFTDEGIIVHLRFAHEVNWYQEDGTYKGDENDFKKGWQAVADACKDNDKIKMFFTPNVADEAQYDKYFPDDLSTVHIIGIDYYTKTSDDFVARMKPFYDKYCKDNDIYFAIGETGLSSAQTMEARLKWLEDATSEETARAMPKYFGLAWFNYQKGYDFKIIEPEQSKNGQLLRLLESKAQITTGLSQAAVQAAQ